MEAACCKKADELIELHTNYDEPWTLSQPEENSENTNFQWITHLAKSMSPTFN